ncbi:MAG: cytochrome c3 family protein [Lysobacterales bacterium]|jgi:methanogenesis multiheme c-type cytochrome
MNRALLQSLFFVLSCSLPATATADGIIEESYHGQMGMGTGTGMAEKWCALANFSFEQEGGVDGWLERGCGDCHIGAAWNPERYEADCYLCHDRQDVMNVPVDGCLNCHGVDTAKRGDLFTAAEDVHIAAGMLCQDCHATAEDEWIYHQFAKGMAIDTTEPTMQGTLSCTAACHSSAPHSGTRDSFRLNQHVKKVACETCHAGRRPGTALAARNWTVFDEEGKPATEWRDTGWLPEYKWYDDAGAGAAGDFSLPVLGYTERRDAPGARIHPFNAVTVTWFVKSPDSAPDDVIPVPVVKAADADGNGTVTLAEMHSVYPGATLLTEDMNFSINHSVLSGKGAFSCDDCHGSNGGVLDWTLLGYDKDPFGHVQVRVRVNRKGP